MEDRDDVLSSKKWYLFGRWRNELPTENQTQELDPKAIHVVNQVPVELDTSEHLQELDPDASENPQELGPNSPRGPQELESVSSERPRESKLSDVDVQPLEG